ncbi:hypothetical protein B7463_g2341, partial [Scytalidium lignicola]
MAPSREELSVFDAIWDVMVGLMILRPSFWYYSLTLATGLTIRVMIEKVAQIYHLESFTTELIEWSAILCGITIYSSLIISWFEIPKAAWLRLSVGFTALFLMLLTEFARRVFAYEEGWRKGILEEDLFASEALGGIGVVFGLMPWILSFLEKDVPANQEKTTVKSKM